MIYLGNAFSLQMLEQGLTHCVRIEPVSVDEVRSARWHSIVGHQVCALALTNIIGKWVTYNRESIKLKPNDTLYVAQIVTGRLPENMTGLPEGTKIEFFKLEILARI